MKKIFLFFCLIFVSVTSFSLELKNNVISDNYGNKIQAKEYKRIIVTDPGVIEILFKIGGEKSIVAIGKTSKSKIYPVDKVDKLPSIGNIINPSTEKILEYKPDLIVVTSLMTKNIDMLKKLGFEVITSSASNLEEILNLIEITGVISGKNTEAQKLREECLKKMKNIEGIKRNTKIKGAILFNVSPITAFPDDSLPGDILKHLNVQNIASNTIGNRPVLSPEFILKENPDFLAGVMSLDDPKQILNASNVIVKTKAGKENNIFILDSSVILRSSYRIFDELESLKDKLEKIK